MNPITSNSSEVIGQLVLIDNDPIRARVKHAIAGFLAEYSGTTLEAYRLDLRGWISWLDGAFLDPFTVERAHIELYARWCEAEGKARSTIGRRLSTSCGFYKYCSQERMIERDPSAHSVARNRTTSPPPSASIATNSARSSCKPACAADATTRSPAYSRSTGCASLKRSAPTSATSTSTAGTAPCSSTARATRPPPSHCRREQHAPSISTSANATTERSS